MAASVQVLCPNGRRQNVKTNPNTKLLQILEEVCQRQGIIPPEDYKLVHGKKALDLSLSVRFSALPNNAKLELAKSAESRVEQDVTIALQLATSQRLQEKFPPSTDLWSILLQFEESNSEHNGSLSKIDMSQSPPHHPVCIFMREEVVGEAALKATTLKKLGLTSGKAIIRLMHRPVDTEVMSTIADQLEKDRLRQAKLEEISLRKVQQQQPSGEGTPVERHITSIPESNTGSLMEVEEGGSNVDRGYQEESMDDDTPSVSLSEPFRDEPRAIVASESRTSRNDAVDALRSMNLPGVEIFTPDDFNDLTPEEQSMARRLAARFMPHLEQSVAIPFEEDRNSPAAQERRHKKNEVHAFNNFKFPESTKGKDLTSQSLADAGRSSQLSQPCQREVLIFSVEETLSPSGSAGPTDVSEEFFDVTADDVKKMYKDLVNSVQKIEDAPLLTSSQRQALAESAFDHYNRLVIRVQFQDGLVLQALFKPRENLSALYSLVKEHLENPSDKFYLYTSPPKTILEGLSTSLAVNQLGPAALVYFGSKSQRDHHLKGDVRSNQCPRIHAEKVVNHILGSAGKDSNTAITNQRDQPGPSGVPSSFTRPRQSGSGTSLSTSGRPNLPSGTPVPKWLKLSKK